MVFAIYYARELYNTLLERTMTRIEECEKLLSKWEAAGNNAYKNKATRLGEVYVDRVYGLKAALAILKRPSNQEVTTGLRCKSCGDVIFPEDTHCTWCGRNTSR